MKARRTATALTALHAVRHAKKHGADVRALEREFGLPDLESVSFADRVSVDTMYELWERVVAIAGPNAPIQASLEALEMRSPLSVLVGGADSIGDALVVLERYWSTVTDDYVFVREEQRGGKLLFGVHDTKGTRPGKHADIAFMLTDIARDGRKITAGQLAIEEIWFPGACDASPALVQAAFSEPKRVRTNTGRTAFLLSEAILKVPLAKLPKVVMEAMERSVGAELRVQSSLADRVTRWIDDQVARGRTPTLADAAKACAVSARTLNRELESAATTFRQRVDDARRRACLESIERTDDDVLARRLGFTNAVSFRRAFRRWTNATPSAYRASLKA